MNYTQPVDTDQQREPILEIWRKQKQEEQTSEEQQEASQSSLKGDQSHVN